MDKDDNEGKERKRIEEIIYDSSLYSIYLTLTKNEETSISKIRVKSLADTFCRMGYRKQGVCEWRPSKKIGNKEIGDGWYDTDCGCTLCDDIMNYDSIYCLNCGNKIKIVEDEDE